MRRIVSAILTLSLAFSLVLAQGESASAAVAGYNSAYAGESVFLNKAAGETGQFSVIFTNTGTQGWFRNIVGLIACLDDKVTCNVAPEEAAYAVNWTSSSVYASVSADTAAGQNGFFIYDFKVPAGTAGSTAAVFNGDVGLIATGALFNPQGYFHINTTPAAAPTGGLTISPTSASVRVSGQAQFTAGNVPTGATPSWSVTGGCGAVTQVGLFVATATNSATQPCSAVVSAGGQTASASIFVFGPPTLIACSAEPSSLVANTANTSVLRGTLRDANGNTVTDDNATSIQFSNNTPTILTPTGFLGITASSGVSSRTYTSTGTAGTGQVSLSSGTLTGCTQTIAVSSPGTATKTAASLSPSTIASDGASTSRVRVTVQDASGNTVISDSTTQISLTRQSGSASVCTPGTLGPTTVAAGIASFTMTSTSTPGSCTVDLTTNNTSIAGTTATFTTAVVGAPNRIAVTSNDSPQTVNTGAAATAITVVTELRDANGLRVTGAAGQNVAITLTHACTDATGGNATPATGSTVLTGATTTTAGRATFTMVSNGTYTDCSLTFSDGTGVSSTNTTVTWTAGSATGITCAFSPRSIFNDGTSTSNGTVRVVDTNGNRTNAGTASTTFASSGGVDSTTQLTSSPQNMSAGAAVFAVKSTTTAGTENYTATAEVNPLTAGAETATCDITTSTTGAIP